MQVENIEITCAVQRALLHSPQRQGPRTAWHWYPRLQKVQGDDIPWQYCVIFRICGFSIQVRWPNPLRMSCGSVLWLLLGREGRRHEKMDAVKMRSDLQVPPQPIG